MSSKEAMIKWFDDRQGRVKYSMDYRLGPNSYDCSSAVFYALEAGGFLKVSYPGNTDTLFGLVGTLFKEISRSEVKRGDIFISGDPGNSIGSGGHTGVFKSNGSFTHCSYTHNGIATDTNDAYMGTKLAHRFYRIIGSDESVEVPEGETQQGELVVDGQWGNGTSRRLQEIHNTAGKDGIISHQYKQPYNQSIYSAQFDNSLNGSNVIYAMQQRLAAKGYYTGPIDGLCGEDTVKALQRAFGTTVDGVISPVSDMVKAMQRALNANKLPF